MERTRRRPPFAAWVAFTCLCAVAVGPLSAHADDDPWRRLCGFVEGQLGTLFVPPRRAPSVHRLTAAARHPRAGVDYAALRAADVRGLPRLRWRSAEAVARLWWGIKQTRPAVRELREISRRRAFNVLTKGLVRLRRTMRRAFADNVRPRDRYRQRDWATPDLYRLLSVASELLSRRLPGARIVLGDVSQVGGGQTRYGTVVRLLRDTRWDDALSRVLAGCPRPFGLPWCWREVGFPLQAFPEEAARWVGLEDRRLAVETLLTGVGRQRGQWVGRAEIRRWLRGSDLEGAAFDRWWRRIRRALRRGQRVWLRRGRLASGRAQWRRVLYRRQIVDVFSRRHRGRLRWRDVIEVRVADFDPRRPDAHLAEHRFVRQPAPFNRATQWTLVYEACHISHLNGHDVDLSYIVDDAAYAFTNEIDHVAAARSRLWIETLYDAARIAAVPIETIFVGPRVLGRLRTGLPPPEQRHPVWALVERLRGHDSHLHLRLPGAMATVARKR